MTGYTQHLADAIHHCVVEVSSKMLSDLKEQLW
jgi:hypothetical protein